MDKPFARSTRSLRLKPLAGCLALALAIGAGSAAAGTTPQTVDPAYAALMQRAQGLAASDSTQPWSMAQRRQQVLAGNHHPSAHALPPVPAGSPSVSNCNDSGPGSLRDTIATLAVTGDTIDLTQTGCSTITLTTGSLAISQADLTLQGPGSAALSIDGGDAVSPLRHAGLGTLSVNDLTVAHGAYVLDAAATTHARGGCIYSAGTVSLSGAEVTACAVSAANTSYNAFGGGVYGQIGVTLSNSTISLGSAGSQNHPGFGGGIDTTGTLSISHSYIGGNFAQNSGGGVWNGLPIMQGISHGTDPYPFPVLTVEYSTISNNQVKQNGGGLFAFSTILIEHSTVSGNSAGIGGALLLAPFPFNAGVPARMLDSTISGNSAQEAGGVETLRDSVISNSTIAFNTNTQRNVDGTAFGAGLLNTNGNVELQSSIVANNTLNLPSGSVPDDIGVISPVTIPVSLTGANNLILAAAAAMPPPADTLSTDPLLSALADNGGPTLTHALGAQSPAIDSGNNASSLTTDQRGEGFVRSIGAATDIGAFELDPNTDTIFADGFDG